MLGAVGLVVEKAHPTVARHHVWSSLALAQKSTRYLQRTVAGMAPWTKDEAATVLAALAVGADVRPTKLNPPIGGLCRAGAPGSRN